MPTAFATRFLRSAKGNLWCEYKGQTLTIFYQHDVGYGWCIADTEGPSYSHKRYATERAAIGALRYELRNREAEDALVESP